MKPQNRYVAEKKLLIKYKVANQEQIKLKAGLTTKQIMYAINLPKS